MGKYETVDQIEAARYLASLPYVDPDRIGIYGWSYGGFMALNCILKGNDVFRKLETLPIPTIAAVNGFALGGVVKDDAYYEDMAMKKGISVQLAKEMDGTLVKRVFATARENGGLIEITDHAEDLKGADVIYGDVWASMGEEAQIPERVGLLSPFRVTMDTLKATENPDVLYLHCLPSFHDFETKMAKEWQAKGVDIREVTDEVFRSRHSVVFDEAENRMHSIKAVMVATIGA